MLQKKFEVKDGKLYCNNEEVVVSVKDNKIVMWIKRHKKRLIFGAIAGSLAALTAYIVTHMDADVITVEVQEVAEGLIGLGVEKAEDIIE